MHSRFVHALSFAHVALVTALLISANGSANLLRPVCSFWANIKMTNGAIRYKRPRPLNRYKCVVSPTLQTYGVINFYMRIHCSCVCVHRSAVHLVVKDAKR